ncbi:MAG: hypothetical protein AAGG44_05585 [Planctomycetota bacterium]
MSSFLRKIKLIFTIRCEQASLLASESCDRKLESHERWALSLHQLVCWSCRQFERQLVFLRKAVRRPEACVPPEFEEGAEMDAAKKERLKQLLK